MLINRFVLLDQTEKNLFSVFKLFALVWFGQLGIGKSLWNDRVKSSFLQDFDVFLLPCIDYILSCYKIWKFLKSKHSLLTHAPYTHMRVYWACTIFKGFLDVILLIFIMYDYHYHVDKNHIRIDISLSKWSYFQRIRICTKHIEIQNKTRHGTSWIRHRLSTNM